MRTTVVVVSWNGAPWIGGCIESILAQGVAADLIVIDNGSEDGTPDIIESFRSRFETGGASLTLTILDSNTGFPTAANLGLQEVLGREATPDGVLLLNQDAALEPGCLEAFRHQLAADPDGGCFGAKNLYPETRLIQHAGGYLERPRMVGLHYGHNQPDSDEALDRIREVDFVTGASMFVRTTTLAKTGLFNEVFSPGYYEDVEFCDRVRQHGLKVVYVPSARVLHHESKSFGDAPARLRLAHRNRLIYLLPELADPRFVRSFTDAEITFIEGPASFDVRRAISGACVDFLAGMGSSVRARFAGSPAPCGLEETARGVATTLRDCCRKTLSRSPD